MIKINNFDEIKEPTTTGYRTLPDGGYIIIITDVEDRAEKQYLYIKYDIAKGDYKDYFKNDFNRSTLPNKRWSGTFIKSYKEKALPLFKAFITSVEKSNGNFKWDFDETKLKGKIVGAVIASEEYMSNTGKVKTRSYVAQLHSVETIEKGNFTVPKIKPLNPSQINATTNEPFFNPFANTSEPKEKFKSPFDEDETSPF